MRHAHSRAIAGLAGLVASFSFAAPALAYVGPGAGLTLLGALWGLIVAVVMSVGFIILWPFRRLLFGHRRKAGGEAVDQATAVDGEIDDSTMLAKRNNRDEP
jgi:hypothetical protein